MMSFAVGVGLLIIGGVFGALMMAAWLLDRRPLIEQFREIMDSPDETEQRVGKPL